ncbi:MAG TPA: Uma2 family endonuclease [Nostocaceae cyanobacterium]|nr:Uma2 family endonuclease [Nostocaceae cyanobacterium]
MVQQLTPETKTPETKIEIIYPDSDGQPMADNTKQYQWIVKIKENLEILFALQEDVFVGGNLLWYPVEGNNKIRQAPDILVVFSRPKGDRGSYQQWKENDIAPQVVFEIISPGNTTKEMTKKLLFYQRYGVEEYYIYDPDTGELTGLLRSHEWLEEIEEINGWVSPRLGIRFELTADTLEIYYPDGRKFLTSVELDQLREQERERAEQERERAEQERERAEQERQQKETALSQLETERQRYQDLLAKLQEKGIDLESL